MSRKFRVSSAFNIQRKKNKMFYLHVLPFFLGLCSLGTSASTAVQNNITKCANVYLKSEWGGMEPSKIDALNEPQSYVLFHHTKTTECSSLATCSWILRLLQDYAVNGLGLTDIGFSFFIGGDGRVYQGRGWNVQGPAISRWYTEALTVGFLGDFKEQTPSVDMMKAARKLVDCAKDGGELPSYVKVANLEQVTPVRWPAEGLLDQIRDWPEWMPGSP